MFCKTEILNDLNDLDLNDRIDEYMYTSGSLLVMSKLPNFVFRKIQNCTGCQIFILGYHLSITFSIILGILGAIT